MKKIIYITSFLVSVGVFSQTTQVTPSATQNYVHKIVYKKGYLESALGSVSNNDKIETISYYDGLGRPTQSVAVRQGGKDALNYDTDIVVPIEYDAYGRQVKDYLPFYSSTNNGKYDTGAITNIYGYYENKYSTEMTVGNSNPYSQKELEASPLNRVLKQAAPGEAWKLGNGHEIEFAYQTNNATDVRLYTVSLSYANNTYIPTLQGGSSYYTAGELYKTITYDENHNGNTKLHTTEEFKDKQGRVLLKRTYAAISSTVTAHDTYYVYDDYGNLTYVLPPKVIHDSSISTTELLELCYQYKYDDRNRLVEKKIPGKDWEYIVYNKLDQPILTQDANQRVPSTDKWLFTKYDAFGRVAYTGEMARTISREALQNEVNGSSSQYVTKNNSCIYIDGTKIYYNNGAYPISYISEILTINYYDDYTFDLDGLSVPVNTTYDSTINGTDLKGLVTGSKVRVLGTANWITTVTGYDEYRRPIWIGTKNNYLSTTDYVESKLKNSSDDISGLLRKIKTTHLKTGEQNIVTIDTFTYDHSGKVLSQTNSINGQAAQAIAVNHYDELGQLITKEVGGTLANELQIVNYKYNIRGWLTAINDVNNIGTIDLFAFSINYNDPQHGATPLYNGNISETIWETANDNVERWYKYGYDALNRITSATDNTGNYNLTSVTYDKMGNIQSLNRKGHTNVGATTFGVMDNLVYTYETNSNKLKKVTDTSGKIQGFNDGANQTTEYVYDTNGNMTSDANKGITSILYNHLNLPTEIKLDNNNNKKINYTYDAVGAKLRKVTNDNGNITTTDYAGNYVYENNILQFFNHSEGYVNNDNGLYKYVYQYRDNLDNVRLSYSDNDNNGTISQSEVIQESNYYPFGFLQKGYNTNVSSSGNSTAQKFKYNGKELNDELGLNWYDYGMRLYNPALGRWNAIDPLVEKYFPLSPYSFAANSPIILKDIEGMDIVGNNGKTLVKSIDENGKIVFADNQVNKKFNKGAIKILKAMAKTPQGRIIIQKLIKSKTKTDFKLVSGNTQDVNYFIAGEGDNKYLKIAFGWTNSNGNILIDDDNNPFVEKSTISIYKGSFDILNGDKSDLPKWARKYDVKQTEGLGSYSDFTKFLNGTGVHEGTHVLNDIFDAMENLNIDKIEVTGKAAKKLFKRIREEVKKSKTKEKKPNENEKKSISEF
jgi:RHS repeat-associated protein